MISFKPFLDKIGLIYTNELQNNIRKQWGIDGEGFSKIEPSTAWGRVSILGKRRAAKQQKKFKRGTFGARSPLNAEANRKLFKGKGKFLSYPTGISVKRLFFTQRFWHGAFKWRSSDDEVRVFANESYYTLANKSLLSFANIIRYNNKGSSEVNPKIKQPPLIFPHTDKQVRDMPAWALTVEVFRSPSFLKVGQQDIKENLKSYGKVYLNL